ncbi:hypothetical protein PR048_019230 [Dryococelus australis]|uniref:Uncharacterized protein n=1 Tax=Dryococelus australis TaxID=614101 RepID=A0ABQ9H303_9NEOP|nr:hypothetical protein PR048_019230 [Dryococelus australis]
MLVFNVVKEMRKYIFEDDFINSTSGFGYARDLKQCRKDVTNRCLFGCRSYAFAVQSFFGKYGTHGLFYPRSSKSSSVIVRLARNTTGWMVGYASVQSDDTEMHSSLQLRIGKEHDVCHAHLTTMLPLTRAGGETREKTLRPAASSGTIPTCQKSGMNRPGIESRSALVGGEQCNRSATVAPLAYKIHSRAKSYFPRDSMSTSAWEGTSATASLHRDTVCDKTLGECCTYSATALACLRFPPHSPSVIFFAPRPSRVTSHAGRAHLAAAASNYTDSAKMVASPVDRCRRHTPTYLSTEDSNLEKMAVRMENAAAPRKMNYKMMSLDSQVTSVQHLPPNLYYLTIVSGSRPFRDEFQSGVTSISRISFKQSERPHWLNEKYRAMASTAVWYRFSEHTSLVAAGSYTALLRAPGSLLFVQGHGLRVGSFLQSATVHTMKVHSRAKLSKRIFSAIRATVTCIKCPIAPMRWRAVFSLRCVSAKWRGFAVSSIVATGDACVVLRAEKVRARHVGELHRWSLTPTIALEAPGVLTRYCSACPRTADSLSFKSVYCAYVHSYITASVNSLIASKRKALNWRLVDIAGFQRRPYHFMANVHSNLGRARKSASLKPDVTLRSRSDKGDTETRALFPVTPTRKAHNWRAIFPLCCVYLWYVKRRPCHFIGGNSIAKFNAGGMHRGRVGLHSDDRDWGHDHLLSVSMLSLEKREGETDVGAMKTRKCKPEPLQLTEFNRAIDPRLQKKKCATVRWLHRKRRRHNWLYSRLRDEEFDVGHLWSRGSANSRKSHDKCVLKPIQRAAVGLALIDLLVS